MIAPLLYVWGDDELLAERLVARFAGRLGAEAGTPLDRWDIRVDATSAAADAGRLYERLATPPMFGGGTLAVVTDPGALVKRNDTRDRVVETIGVMAPGHALVFVEAARSNAKGPGIRRLADPVKAAGGTIASAMAPRPTALAAWITDEARDRDLSLATGAARELADRLGARVTEGDVDRRYLSRVALGELDKLELRHAMDEGSVTPEDVRALVAETTPASVWALGDAVGERRADAATATLERLLETTPEPVILAVLHRRIVELLAIGDRMTGGLNVPEAARAMGITNEFRAKTLAGQARRWTAAELTEALAGLVTLDATVKGAPGYESDAAQRRLAFVLWIRDHVAVGVGASRGGERRTGPV